MKFSPVCFLSVMVAGIAAAACQGYLQDVDETDARGGGSERAGAAGRTGGGGIAGTTPMDERVGGVGGESRATGGNASRTDDAAVVPPNSGPPNETPSRSDAGTSRADAGTIGDGSPPTGQLVFVAVGYSGRRVRSIDKGLTWVDAVTSGGGGDDNHLLRSVTYGFGKFIAMGHRTWTSVDGKAWAEVTSGRPSGWVGGLQFGNGRVVGAGGYGLTIYSLDGAKWATGTFVGQGAPSRSLAFGDGTFMAASDYGGVKWWKTTDGVSWTQNPTGGSTNRVAFCDGTFKDANRCSTPWNGHGSAYAGGVWIRLQNGMQRSTDDGKSWQATNAGSGIEDVTFGYVQREE